MRKRTRSIGTWVGHSVYLMLASAMILCTVVAFGKSFSLPCTPSWVHYGLGAFLLGAIALTLLPAAVAALVNIDQPDQPAISDQDGATEL